MVWIKVAVHECAECTGEVLGDNDLCTNCMRAQAEDEEYRNLMWYCSCGFFTANAKVAGGHSVGANHAIHYWITKEQAEADARFRMSQRPNIANDPCVNGCRCVDEISESENRIMDGNR